MLLFNISFIIPCCLLLVAFLYGISSRKLRDNQQTRRYLLYLGFFLSTELVRLTASYILNIKLADYLYLFYVAGEFLLLLYFFHKVLTLLFTFKWISYGNFSSFNSKQLEKILSNSSSWLAISSCIAKNCDIIKKNR